MLWQRALAENDRATPERRAQFERDLRTQVTGIGDETVRKHYLADLASRLAALWQPSAAGGRRRSLAASPFRPRRGGRGLEKPWEMPAPASPQLRALARAGARPAAERRLRMILLSAVNHPELLHEFLDDIAFLEISAGELDSLRSELIESAGLGGLLDRQALRSNLSQKGLGPVLDRMEAQARRLNEWFLGSAAAQDDARTGLRQMIALHRKSVTLDRELRAAEAAFAEDPSEDNLNTLNAVREQLSSHAGAEAHIEGFGQASGRPAGDIA